MSTMTPHDIAQALSTHECQQCRKYWYQLENFNRDLAIAARKASRQITPSVKLLDIIKGLREMKARLLSDIEIHLVTCEANQK